MQFLGDSKAQYADFALLTSIPLLLSTYDVFTWIIIVEEVTQGFEVFWENNFIYAAFADFYRPQTKLQEGDVFSPVVLFTRGRGSS